MEKNQKGYNFSISVLVSVYQHQLNKKRKAAGWVDPEGGNDLALFEFVNLALRFKESKEILAVMTVLEGGNSFISEWEAWGLGRYKRPELPKAVGLVNPKQKDGKRQKI